MEALLEKEGEVESWNDDRLDELSRRIDSGFERAATKAEMNQRFDEVDRRFDEVDRRFNEVDRRFEGVDQNFGKVEHALHRIDDRLDKLFYLQLFFMASLAIGLITDAV
jgi:archaellum component FlaC